MTGPADMAQAAEPAVKRFEGFGARPYLCPAGVWTQGYGRTGHGIGPRSARISQATADDWLDADLPVYAAAALALSPVLARLPAEVGAAITDFCFNLGTTRYKASTLRRRVAAQDWQGAAHQLALWVHGGGRKLPGLVQRRAFEAAMILRAMAAARDDTAQADLVDRARRILSESKDPLGDLRRLLVAA